MLLMSFLLDAQVCFILLHLIIQREESLERFCRAVLRKLSKHKVVVIKTTSKG